MIGKNIDSSQGEHSIAVQNTGVVHGNVNIGLSLEQVEDLFHRMFSEKFPVLLNEAAKESREAIADFAYKLYSKIDSLNEGKIDVEIERKFASADFQTLLFKTVEQVGSKANNAPKELLVNLLLKKLSSDNEDYHINQVIDTLKYINRNQILFLIFSTLHKLVINFNVHNRLLDIYSIYENIDRSYMAISEKKQKKEFYSNEYKKVVNEILSSIYSLNPTFIDIGLLSPKVLSSGSSYYIVTGNPLGNFGKFLNKNDYTWDMLYLDFPLYADILERFGGNRNNPIFFIQELNSIGNAIIENIDLNNFKV